MKNLLPAQRQRTLTQVYFGRLSVVALAFVITIEAVVLVVLLPSYLAAHMQQGAHEQALEEAERQISEGGGNVARTFLGETDILLSYAEATQHHPSTTDLITLMQINASPGIAIEDFSLRTQNTGLMQATISGEAVTRTALVQYTEVLESDPRIAEVILPLRDLAASQNITFTISVYFTESPR